MRMEYVEAVLDVVALIPTGAAVAYGDVAELLGVRRRPADRFRDEPPRQFRALVAGPEGQR